MSNHVQTLKKERTNLIKQKEEEKYLITRAILNKTKKYFFQ